MGPDVAAALSAAPVGFPVWPANMGVVSAFAAVGTQWVAIGTGTSGLFWMGLDYMRVKAGFEFADIALTKRQWSELRLMERTAALALNGVAG